jgi:hypothetical protein
MAQKRKGGVSKETFDEFLAEQGILGATEDHPSRNSSPSSLPPRWSSRD